MSNVLSTAQITKIKTLLSQTDTKADEIVAKFGAVSAVSPISDFWAISDITSAGEDVVSKALAAIPVVSAKDEVEGKTGNKINNIFSAQEAHELREKLQSLRQSFALVRFEIERCETQKIVALGQLVLRTARSIHRQTARIRGFLPGGLIHKTKLRTDPEVIDPGKEVEWTIADLFQGHSKAKIDAVSSDDSKLVVTAVDSKTVKARIAPDSNGSNVSLTISARDGNTLVEQVKKYQVQV